MQKVSLAKNTIYITAAQTVSKVIVFIYFWLVSSSLIPEQLGQYVFALSFAAMFGIFIDWGLAPILTREASKHPDQANLYLRNILAIKLPLAVITLLSSWLIINLTGKTPQVRSLVYISTLVMVLDNLSLGLWVIFRSRQNLFYESVSIILIQSIIFSLGVLALKTTGQVSHLIMALLAASAFNILFVGYLLIFKLHFTLWPRYDREVVIKFLKIVPAFALAGIFVKIYNAADSVILSYIDSDSAVGFYAIPCKVVYALQQVIPAAFASAIFPLFADYHRSSPEKLQSVFMKAFNYLTIISFPVMAGLLVLVPQILNRIWPQYLAVENTFYLMILAIPFIFWTFPTGYLLNACDQQAKTTFNRGIITTLSVALNLMLIPFLSFFGAGLTFFITNFILLFLDWNFVRKIIPLDYAELLKVLGKVLISCLAMVAVLFLIRSYFSVFLVTGMGGLVYFITLWLLKGFDYKEILALLKKNKPLSQDL